MKLISPITGYFKGVIAESKKIAFPSRSRVINDSVVVIVSTIIGMAFLALIDFLILSLWEKIII